MCPLRRVEDHQAGPSALGILVPPGRRTFLILRPRSLSWDLLLLRPDAVSAFRELHRDEANTLAQELSQALTSESETSRVEEVAGPDGRGIWLRIRVGVFALLVCGRQPGQPYQPLVFADAETAWAAAGQLRDILCPSGDIVQEVYLNTHHFTR
ncbi:MAG TPA: hypothetical protein VN688_03475 [Gemmataceae bacterium]|nr:hypothetical protein [Gemmataceae bacterium]